jgi:hypothetical protein
MAISGDYAQPVQVNGFTCRNCTDVDYAKKHIDPAHPRSGPYDVDAVTDPSRKTEAVVFGGGLEGMNKTSDAARALRAASAYAAGDNFSLTA